MACNCALPQFRFGRNSFGIITRYDWRVDVLTGFVSHRPAGDIHRRDVIRESRKPADHAGELTLTLSIGFVHLAAVGTGAAGVARVDHDPWHPCPLRFVVDKLAELKERPTVQSRFLGAPNRNSRANTRQIFQSNCPLSALRFSDYLFAEAVVGIFRKTPFLTGELFEFALG